MAQEKPSIRPEIDHFTSRSRTREIVEGGMSQGFYKMRVTQKQNFLSISVANNYQRNMGQDLKPYYSAFRIDLDLDSQGGINGLKRSIKEEAKVGVAVMKKEGLRKGTQDINRDIIANYPKGRFWATVSLGNGKEMHLGFFADKNNLASLGTVVLDGRVLDNIEVTQILNKIRISGLELPEIIDVFQTASRLLTQKIDPRDMRDNPFVGYNLHWAEQEHNSKNK